MKTSGYQRWKTWEVYVGKIPVGGNNPVRIQSMTNTDSLNTELTVRQIQTLAESGCEIVRLSIPSVAAARNLENIRKKLDLEKIDIPLVADIHFNQEAALIASDFAQKIRINPGNFAKCTGSELESVFSNLVHKLKKNKTALRIGVNHGSLSPRIMDLYGNTVEGMVQSAIEYLEIAESLDYRDIILSIKASIPSFMVQAYEALIQELNKRNTPYPLHVGVTEAGEGLEGRVKSAIGTGALLLKGYGDTIRVSLSEPPENEIPVAKHIIQKIESLSKVHNQEKLKLSSLSPHGPENIPNHPYPLVGIETNSKLDDDFFNSIGYQQKKQKWIKKERSPDFIITDKTFQAHIPKIPLAKKTFPDSSFPYLIINSFLDDFYFNFKFFCSENSSGFKTLILSCYSEENREEFLINTAMFIGSFFLEQKYGGIILKNPNLSHQETLEIAYTILQASRQRMTQTDYISCPTCGRTKFNLMDAVQKIRKATAHLAGLKIAIMGCIVNGPGEMADADYGYVGSGHDKISLFKGKTPVLKNIPSEDAVKELIELIKKDGVWKEPE